LGSELTKITQLISFGSESIIGFTDLQNLPGLKFEYCRFEVLGCDGTKKVLRDLVENEKDSQIYHLACVLSATGEEKNRCLLGI